MWEAQRDETGGRARARSERAVPVTQRRLELYVEAKSRRRFFLQPTRGDLDSGSSRGTERGRLPVNTSEKKIDSDVRRKRRKRSREGSERSSTSPLTATGNRKPVRQEARAPARLRPKGRCFRPVQFGQLQGLSGNSQSPG